MARGMAWHTTTVQGRRASYGVMGEGRPVVLLHGWALSHRSYRRGLEQLAGSGVQVWTPALPGFGGTAALPPSEFSLAGYAAWVDAFLDAVEITEPVTLIGHSFGGGVALKTAHAHPHRIGMLVLVNSIGGPVWRASGRATSERPFWDWGLHLATSTLSVRSLTRVLPVVASDAVPNVVRRPQVVWHVGRLAREADLSAELEELKQRRLPVVILWGRQDTVIPWACAESLASALDLREIVTVPGSHSWLLEDPSLFAEILTNVIDLPINGDQPAA